MGRDDAVIISEHTAKQLWPGTSGVGRVFRLGEKG